MPRAPVHYFCLFIFKISDPYKILDPSDGREYGMNVDDYVYMDSLFIQVCNDTPLNNGTVT